MSRKIVPPHFKTVSFEKNEEQVKPAVMPFQPVVEIQPIEVEMTGGALTGGTLNKVFQQGFPDVGGQERLNEKFNIHLKGIADAKPKKNKAPPKIKITKPVDFDGRSFLAPQNPMPIEYGDLKVIRTPSVPEPKKPRGRPKKNP